VFLTFRWFGADDPVSLAHIRQIPGVRGIVQAGPTHARSARGQLCGKHPRHRRCGCARPPWHL